MLRSEMSSSRCAKWSFVEQIFGKTLALHVTRTTRFLNLFQTPSWNESLIQLCFLATKKFLLVHMKYAPPAIAFNPPKCWNSTRPLWSKGTTTKVRKSQVAWACSLTVKRISSNLSLINAFNDRFRSIEDIESGVHMEGLVNIQDQTVFTEWIESEKDKCINSMPLVTTKDGSMLVDLSKRIPAQAIFDKWVNISPLMHIALLTDQEYCL